MNLNKLLDEYCTRIENPQLNFYGEHFKFDTDSPKEFIDFFEVLLSLLPKTFKHKFIRYRYGIISGLRLNSERHEIITLTSLRDANCINIKYGERLQYTFSIYIGNMFVGTSGEASELSELLDLGYRKTAIETFIDKCKRQVTQKYWRM